MIMVPLMRCRRKGSFGIGGGVYPMKSADQLIPGNGSAHVEGDEFPAVFAARLLQDVADVEFDGVLGDGKGPGDLGVGLFTQQ